MEFPKRTSADLLRHRSLQARCRHPRGERTEFAREELERSIPARFEKMVLRYPDHLAVKTKNAELTFRELDAAANRLAHAIIQQRGPAAEPVGVLARHGREAVVATLATLKAGKFYVPLDPKYPRDRLNFMLHDTSVSLIVTDDCRQTNAAEWGGRNVSVLTMDEKLAELPTHCPQLQVAPEAFAGVYYTSGSTGRPKGIVYSHRSLLHNMHAFGAAFQVSAHDRWSWLHSYSFSASANDIFCPLLHGAAVCAWDVLRDGLTNLAQWLEESRVTIFNWMATPFRSLATSWPPSQVLADLRLVVFGGETLFTRDAVAFRRYFSPACLLVNRLGSTEAGIIRLSFTDQETPLGEGAIPAGYAVPDKTVVILDENGVELAPGNLGEIGVRSQYLPPGYWRQPELTREKYRRSPSGGEPRTYLTGDLGRLRDDGCLEHCGRKDSQVKVRGHRVETGEIESVLRACEGVREAVVKAHGKPDGDTYLTAYFVPAPDASLDESGVRQYLLGKLPGHMIPSTFVRLNELPKNANQKVDLAALPMPTIELRSDRFKPPRTPLQRQLVELWQTILQVEPISIEDDFFALGGDSLLATQVVSRVRNAFAIELPLPTIFQKPTLTGLASSIEEILNLAKSRQEETNSRIWKEIEGLSDEEAERFLMEHNSEMPYPPRPDQSWIRNQ